MLKPSRMCFCHPLQNFYFRQSFANHHLKLVLDALRALGGLLGCAGRGLGSEAAGAGSRGGGLASSVVRVLACARNRLACLGSRLRGRDAGDGRCGAEAGLGFLGGETELVQEVVVVLSAEAVRVGGGLRVVVPSGGRGSAVSGGSRALNVVSRELSGVLAGKGLELVALATLWDVDTVLVEPRLEVSVAPAVDELITERLGSGACGSRGGRGLRCGAVGSGAGVAAERGNQLVAAGGLRGWDATLIEPSLEIGLRPGVVEPVARVRRSLTDFVGGRLVVGAGGRKK